jgi:hypothetical protein
MVSVAEIAQAFGDATREGRSWRCRCPLHGGRSLVLKTGRSTPIVFHCWGGCDQSQLAAEFRRRGFLDGSRNARPQPLQVPPRIADNRALALRSWAEATTALAGTPAETYLAGCALWPLPAGVDGRSLRFHPHCRFGNEHHPALIGLFTGIADNVPRAIHRIGLTPDGSKIGKGLSLGPKAGCAIKLTPDEDVTTRLAIGEGLETTLAGMSFDFIPAWCVGGVVGTSPVLPGIEALTIFVDADANEAGPRATGECSTRWTTAGREVLRVIPNRTGEDLADIVKRWKP